MTEPSPPIGIPSALRGFLQEHLGPAEMRGFSSAIETFALSDRSLLFELLSELIEVSPRSAAACIRVAGPFMAGTSPGTILSWLDLGVTLAGQSSVTAQRYFKESPEILPKIRADLRKQILGLGLELCDGPYGVVIDFLRAASTLPGSLEPAQISRWMQAGLELAREDLVLAIEFFRISPRILEFISVEDLPEWIRLGKNLIEPNALDKPDYLKVIEFFRLSHETFSDLKTEEIRRLFIATGNKIAPSSPTRGLEFLRETPGLLKEFNSDQDSRLLLFQGFRLAGLDPSMTLDFLRGGPKMFHMLEGNPADFTAWVDTGVTLFTQNPERGRAYFRGRSKAVQETTERLIGGVTLQNTGRILQLIAEAMTGTRVILKPSTEIPAKGQQPRGDLSTTDGRIIYLPPRIRQFPDDRDNFRLYKLSLFHEAGHLEFGTYRPGEKALNESASLIRKYYPASPGIQDKPNGISDILKSFPNPAWARFLWEILEDARVDYRIRSEYPGIRKDLEWIISLELQNRPGLEGLPPRAAIREALVQLSVTDTTEVSLDVAEAVSGSHTFLSRVKTPSADSGDSLRILPDLYFFLEKELAKFPEVDGEADPMGLDDKQLNDNPDQKTGRGNSKVLSGAFPHRGQMNPEWVEDQQSQSGTRLEPEQLMQTGSKAKNTPEPESRESSGGSGNKKTSETPPKNIDQTGQTPTVDGISDIPNFFFYDEWDEAALEFRPRWCRLKEHQLESADNHIVEETLSSYRPMLRNLRRSFQSLHPEAFRKVKHQESGEEIDLNAVVENRTDFRTGRIPSERIYIKTEKRVRDVAVAFLVDMSGSTSRHIPAAGRRVIDIEKEALILMAEALRAVGDEFAIYGFSGGSRDNIEFYIIKDFSDSFNREVHQRIGSMRSMNQNRDGTAIRHATSKLNSQDSRTRLLILLSDGRPLDSGYTGQYSIQDTKIALRDARKKGIHPYCITVDQEANRYVSEMYGEVRHTIIDRVGTLPEKLPRIYRRLTT